MDQDIIVIGSGSAGLAFANSFANTDLQITLIDKQSVESIAHPALDGRETAVSAKTKRILEAQKVWQQIDNAKISCIEQAKVLNGNSDYALHFDARAINNGSLGYIVPHNLLKKSLYNRFNELDNCQLIASQAVTAIDLDAKKTSITLANGSKLHSKLLVAADGKFSYARGQLGLATSTSSIGRSVIVANMRVEKAHNNIAYECFGYDKTLAVLPLADQHVSIVITINTAQVKEIIDLDEAAFNQQVASDFKYKLGCMQLVTRRFSYPLVMNYADNFAGMRCALIGDAAVSMHPVTAHGFNFGIQGQNLLSSLIKDAYATGADIANKRLLSSYAVQHRRNTKPLYLATNALVNLYTSNKITAKTLRKGLLHLGNIIKPANRFIVNRLTKTN